MWKRVIWTKDRMPETIRAVDTRYCSCSWVKLAPPAPAMMSGGLMMPASMDRECWKPSSSARTTGMGSLRPKKGDESRDAFMKGRFGRKRKA